MRLPMRPLCVIIALAGAAVPAAAQQIMPPNSSTAGDVVTLSDGTRVLIPRIACTDTAGARVSCGGAGGGGGAVTVADGADTAEGSRADTASTAIDTTPATMIGLSKGQIVRLNGIATNQATQIAAEQAVQANQTNGNQISQVRGTYSQASTLTAQTVGSSGPMQLDQYWNQRALMLGQMAALGDGYTVFANSTFNNRADGGPGTAGPLNVLGNYATPGGASVYARGDTLGAYVVSKGGASILTGQVSVGTTSTLIAAARTGRQKIGVTVTTAVQCAFGAAGVTLATGWPLAAVAYASDSWDTAAALYGVCASTATTAYREQF